MIRYHTTQRTDAIAQHGEGPVWDPRGDLLHWVDMTAGDVLSMNPMANDAPSRRHVGDLAAALRPRTNGGWVIATENAFLLTDENFGVERSIAVFADPEQRFNDGGCTVEGDFLCGTMASSAGGALYRLRADLQVEMEFDGVTISNGLSPNPAGDRLYYVDTVTGRIDVFDSQDGRLSGRRPWVHFEDEDGSPDGIAVDAEGGVWVAMWGAGTVRRYDAAGQLSAIVDVPTKNPTACAFGGADLGELFITSSQMETVDDPRAGALFSVDVGVVGLPVASFAG